jgi:hypothetical protein
MIAAISSEVCVISLAAKRAVDVAKVPEGARWCD